MVVRTADLAGTARSPGIAPVRAFVVLVLFVVAAIALVAVGTRPTVSGDAATPSDDHIHHGRRRPQDDAHHDHHDRPPQLGDRRRGQCDRDERPGGALRLGPDRAGVGRKAATDAATTEATSSVYYAAGQQEAAASIATTLGLKPAAVVPLTTAVPVTGASGGRRGGGRRGRSGPACHANPAPAMGALPEVLLPFARGSWPQRPLPRLRRHPARPSWPTPSAARPWPGVPAFLARLAARFALVAVISGRPTDFLHEALGSPAGVTLIGLYGLGHVGPDARPWEPVIAAAGRIAPGPRRPPGIYVEPKGLTVTLHWRHAPETGSWAAALRGTRGAAGAGYGSIPDGCRSSSGLPSTWTRARSSARWSRGMRAVAVFGDDLGDLPAFAAAAELGERGVAVARVAVIDAESDDRGGRAVRSRGRRSGGRGGAVGAAGPGGGGQRLSGRAAAASWSSSQSAAVRASTM